MRACPIIRERIHTTAPFVFVLYVLQHFSLSLPASLIVDETKSICEKLRRSIVVSLVSRRS